MKSVALLIALVGPLQAELLANFQTSKGNVVVALQYDKTPQTVANFITLSQGTRKRLNVATGVVTNAPFYIGEKFFRVIDDATFKIAQTGSGNGTNAGGGPGYTFKDEFDTTLTHVPYVLSMANSGPNSNGSQIFFTGNASVHHLNNVHTIFGLVTDSASRAVIDAIHAAGDNATTITGVTISRTDPAAVAFDEFAQNLPIVTQPDGQLTVSRNVSTTWHISEEMTAGAIFRAFRSTTMTTGSWSELNSARRHVGITPPPSTPEFITSTLDTATAPSAFYNLSVTRHPGAVGPSTLANRTVTIPLAGATLSFVFNATGIAGNTIYQPTSGAPLGGPFTTVNPNNGYPLAPSFDAHHFTFTADTPSLNPRYFWIKAGCDSATSSSISGHHATQYYDYNFGWQTFTSGPLTITR